MAEKIARGRVGGAFWKTTLASPSVPRIGSSRAITWCDPWPSINSKEPISARIDDELALLAAAAGRPVHDLDSGQPHAPDDLLQALCRRLMECDYFDPWNGHPITLSTWIDILSDWRRQIDQNHQIATVCGIAAWKRPMLDRFLWADPAPPFAKTPPTAPSPPGKTVAVWPSRVALQDRDRARAADGRLIQIEDGFIRSAGLGSRLVPPCSIVVDQRGIYYDPRTPSDLEDLLAHAELGPDLCRRAANLIRFITYHGITKYGEAGTASFRLPSARRTVLVTGQVSDDYSVRLGRADVESPLDLLRRAREAEPDAFLIFKPHPDVAAGLRRGTVASDEAALYADMILPEASIQALLGQVDAVHVLTSLTGFEALLRGREVITHGQPFYAGWGLTRDLAPSIERRGRKLTLAQLVAATLILYPRYHDPITGLPCPPEILTRRLAVGVMPKPGPLQSFRTIQGRITAAWRQLAVEQ